MCLSEPLPPTSAATCSSVPMGLIQLELCPDSLSDHPKWNLSFSAFWGSMWGRTP